MDSTQASRPVREGAAALRTLRAALESLLCAVQGCGVYGPEHPAVRSAVRDAASGLREILAADGAVRVAVTDQVLMWGEHELSPHGALGELARRLHALDVAAIEFRPALEVADVERLVRRLHFARSPELSGGKLARRIDDDTRGSVSLQPISYGALHIAEGARGPEERTSAGRVTWPDLIASLANESPEAIAARFNECADEADETSLEEARDRIREIAATIDASPADEQDSLRRRLDSFVGTLSPRLRHSLLRMDPGAPEQSFTRMIDLMGVFPTDDVLEALQQVNSGQFRQSDEVLRMFGKLHRILEQRTDEHVDHHQVQELFGRIGQGVESSREFDDPEKIRSSVEELFRIRSVEDVSPDDYREQLDNLIQPAASDAFRFGDEELTAEEIAGQAAELAGHLVQSHDPADHTPGLYRHLASRIDQLEQRDRVDLLLSVARAAAQTSGEGFDPETRSAAGAFLEELIAPRRLDDLLRTIADRGDQTPREVIDLLSFGGVPALRTILGDPKRDLPDVVVTVLRQVASGCDPAEIEQLVLELSREGSSNSTRIDLLLDVLPDSVRRQAIEPLLSHSSPSTRLSAFSRLSRQRGWSSDLLKLALADDQTRIQSLALDHFSNAPDSSPAQLLTSYIGGDLSASLPGRVQQGRAVELLAARPDGLAGLCEILRLHLLTVRSRRARLAARLADALTPHQYDVRVRRTLRRWRMSPARLLDFIMGKVGRHG